jgi:hypothetical protein
MNKNIKICIFIGFLAITLYILHYNKSQKSQKSQNLLNKEVIYGGEEETGTESNMLDLDNLDCTMEKIEKHNSATDKWIYNNGNIYDLTPILETELVNSDVNIENIIKFFKLSKEQDLSKLFLSVESYNKKIDEFNSKNQENPLLRFDFSNLDNDKITEDNPLNKEQQRIFDKFKFIVIKSISQFSKGIICPAGLKI